MSIKIDPRYNRHYNKAFSNIMAKYHKETNYEDLTDTQKKNVVGYCDAYAHAKMKPTSTDEANIRIKTATPAELAAWEKSEQAINEALSNIKPDERNYDNEFFLETLEKKFFPNVDTKPEKNGDFSSNDTADLLGNSNNSYKNIKDGFEEAKGVFPTAPDPLIIDLDGNGIETTPLTDGMMMDHDKDGFKELSAWVGGNDGILAYDKNNNGVIDNGNELFGDNYEKSDGTIATSGFDALSDLDTNNDGVINSSDENFSNLTIIKGDGEYISVEEAGIESINLTYQSKNDLDENGNRLLHLGSYTTTDGQVRNIGDYSLQVDKTNSIEAYKVALSPDIESLPNIAESGTVHSLHQAMALDETGELQELVESFVAETNVGEKKSILTQILYKWTGADEVVDGSRGENFDAKKLHVLEQFLNDELSIAA